MADNIQIDPQARFGGLLYFPSGEEIYNAFMSKIEPDLLTQNVDGLAEKYKGETDEQREARKLRYQKAYALYEAKLAEWFSGLTTEVKNLRRAVLRASEEKEVGKKEGILATLESKFSELDPSSSPSGHAA